MIYGVMASVMVLISVTVSLVLVPISTRYFPSADLFTKSKTWLQPEMEFASYGFNEPSLVWYFRSKVKGWHTYFEPGEMPRAMQAYMEKPGRRFCILPTAMFNEVFPESKPGWKIFQTQGFNLAKGEKVDLRMVIQT